MGQEFSHQNSIHVATERPVYHPGDLVRGNIYLNVVKEIHCEGVHIKVTGYEKTSWEVQRTRQVPVEGGQPGQTRAETYHQPFGGKKEFFKVKIPVYNASNNVFLPGQFALPFEFGLPQGLPGVFDERGAHGTTHYSAQIVYKIKAECHVSGFMKSDLKHKQHLILREHDLSGTHPVSREGSSNVTQYCCINRGTAFMRVHTDKQMYTPGETAQVVCEVDNQSTVRIRRIKVKLFQKLRLDDGLGHHYETTQCICDSLHDGVEPMTRLLEDKARHVPLTLTSRTSGLIQPQVTVGRLVHCSYFLQCQLDVPMGGDVNVRVPIVIQAHCPSQARWELQAPPDFHPNIMPSTTVNIAPSAPPLPPGGFNHPSGGPVQAAPPAAAYMGQANQGPPPTSKYEAFDDNPPAYNPVVPPPPTAYQGDNYGSGPSRSVDANGRPV
eukprot:TRINITY_DN40986_c0_g1_i1.p1 TRINITY_DN40986_c0_g1~~TRINITY_DN40986_c0_g1_i1.p1  ORF type:complete len:438 (-),score=15.62 TRINITY_DN40986_c0_g1_i1:81-1394(-)